MKEKKYLNFKIILGITILIIFSFPYYVFNIDIPKLVFNKQVVLQLINLIVVVLLSIYYFVNFLIFITKNKMLKKEIIFNEIVDKILIISLCILLAANGYVSGFISILLLIDFVLIFIAIKYKKTIFDQIKSLLVILGIVFSLLNNLPFSLIGLNVNLLLFIASMVMIIISIGKIVFDLVKNEKPIDKKEEN